MKTRAFAGRPWLLALVLPLLACSCDRLRDPHDRGVRYLNAGRYADAANAFGEAIEKAAAAGDTSAEAIGYANRCYANDMLGEQDRAVADCTRSLELVPDDAEVINNRAVAYLNKGLLDEAEEDLDRAIELRPDYAAAYANRGRMWLEREDFERALEDLDEAIELEPGLAQAYANRGSAKDNLGRKEEALADFDRSLELRADALVYFTRGMFHLRYAEFDAAYDDYMAAAKLEPDSYVGYMASTEARFLENRPTPDPDAATATATESGTALPSEEGTSSPSSSPTDTATDARRD